MFDQPTRTLQPPQRETQDVGLRFILRLLGLIGTVLMLMIGFAWWLFPAEVADRRFARPFPDFPGPRLQASPRVDMAAFYAEEMARLNSVGWQDKHSGTVHIPIDQAMRLVAKEGIAGWPAGDPNVSLGDRR